MGRPRNLTAEMRFHEKYVEVTPTGCWIWTGPLNKPSGYGFFWYNERNERAHRASWMLHYGTIPNGMHVLHKCDVPCCVNPTHLFLGTDQDNVKDCIAKGRRTQWNCGAAHRRKLSDSDVVEIRRLKGTVKAKELAKRFGVSRFHIHSLQRYQHRADAAIRKEPDHD